MAITPIDLNHMATVPPGGMILITSDGGEYGALRSALVPGHAGYNSSIAYANNSVPYVASENPYGQSVWVVESSDGGLTWAPASNGLPNMPVQTLLAGAE